MKLKLVIIFLVLGFFSCEKEPKFNLHVKGEIKGIRKGDLYLQKLEDSLLINLDSVQFSSNEDFELKAYIEEPQLMFLYLKKFGSEDDVEYLNFFAEAGEFEFNVKMEDFPRAKANTAPENQQKYEAFKETMKRFNDQNLDLISERIQTAETDTAAQLAIDKKYNNLLKRKYLYTVNFAVRNADLEVAPFVVLTEAYDVNKRFLDTVYNSLSDGVKNSKYAKELKELIDLRNEESTEKPKTEIETLDEDVNS